MQEEGFGWVGNHMELDLQVIESSDQHIHSAIRDKHGCISFFFTGFRTVDDRKTLWQSLNASIGSNPWLISGDFNSLLSTEDRINGTPVTITETRDFNECLRELTLEPIKSTGHYFSWHKGIGEGKIWSRIDWSLGNEKWLQQYTEVTIDYLNSSISDHSPLLITCLPNSEGGYMANHSRFLQTVMYLEFRSIMDLVCTIQGSCMYQLWYKLKVLKGLLKRLHKQEFANTALRVEKARED